MKLRFWALGLAGFLALGVATTATTYYIDDSSNDGDVYTPTATGNPENDGTSPATPKLTLNNLLATTNLLPGDVILIDVGTYTNNVVISAAVNGAASNRILFAGVPITNGISGATTFSPPDGYSFDVSGNHLHFRDIKAQGGTRGFNLNNSSFGEYERVLITGTANNPLFVSGASSSNAFRNCVFVTGANAAAINCASGTGNYLEHCVGYSTLASAVYTVGGSVSNVASCILVGNRISTTAEAIPSGGTRNVLWGSSYIFGGYETLGELQRINTNWYHNTVADPKFVNADALDFHLLSAAGFVSNGVWVTNPAVGYSPGIDFGPQE